MYRLRPAAASAAFALLALVASCAMPRLTRPAVEPPPPGLVPTRLDYADTDAFDTLFEAAILNQDPAILVQTQHAQPDWGDRLNAWIAAWNLGGQPAAAGEKVRMQAPVVPQVVVDGDSIREFRLLIESLMNRLDDRTREGLAWLAEEKTRSRRVRLLRPYNLRFHLDKDGLIQLIFFNGRYAGHHREFVRGLAGDDQGEEWERKMVCSMCAGRRAPAADPRAPGRLTSGGGEEPK
jgi:hypothetical protein